MRKVNNVRASIGVLAKASFTMIALVENNMAPVTVMRKPASETLLCSDFVYRDALEYQS